MIRVVLLFLVLFAGWLLMSGHYTPLITSFGVLSCALCAWLSWRIGATDEEGLPTHLFARLPAYLLWLLREIISSNIATAKIILFGGAKPEIFEVPATQQTAAGLVTYANSITLTPGTVTIDIHESASPTIIVHALHSDFGDDVRSGEMDRRVTDVENQSQTETGS
ncbi:Na+/H+ antiporter subunit E [Alphaproteobacteria bacterium]|nr:Na+/H+ antiporter subunit E [Alphaproteobacteria bacterium]